MLQAHTQHALNFDFFHLLKFNLIFFPAIDYINELEMDRSTHEHQIESLKKEILALKILKS